MPSNVMCFLYARAARVYAVDQLLLTAFSCKSPLSIQISDTIDDTVPSIQSDPC